MLVGKALRMQQLNLIEQLQVGHMVVVVDSRKKLETVYTIADEVLLNMIKSRLRREVVVLNNYIKLYEEKDPYELNTTLKAIRQQTEQVI